MDVDWTELRPRVLELSLPLAQRRLTQQYVARVRKIFPEEGPWRFPLHPGPQ